MSTVPVQVAFQGGGAKIVDLLAVAEALQEAESKDHIRITRLAGTSAGSIVACLLAAEKPVKEVVELLQSRGRSDLESVIKQRLLLRHLYQVWRHRPIYDEERLGEWLKQLFPRINQLKDLSRDVFVVTTDLAAATKRVLYSNQTDPEAWIRDVLVDSCALPFVFRSSSSKRTRVDGGLCENLPVDELVGGEVDYGRVVAVSFRKERPRSPRNSKDFAIAFISAAIENTVDRSLRILDQDRVFRIETDLQTFDFIEAFEALNGDHYKLIRETARNWLDQLIDSGRLEPNPRDLSSELSTQTNASNPEKADGPETSQAQEPDEPSPILLEDVWRDRSPSSQFLMRRLDMVYKQQHEPEEIEIESSTFLVIANCLAPAGSDDHGRPDIIRQTIRIRPKANDIYCFMVGLVADSGDQDGSFLRQMRLEVSDSTGKKNEAVILPLSDSSQPAGLQVGLTRRAGIFFNPVLKKGCGLHTIRQVRKFRNAMLDLSQGRTDTIGNRNVRPNTTVGHIDLLLFVPDSAPQIDYSWSEGSPTGEEMDSAALEAFADVLPVGFRAMGWTCRNVEPKVRFGVDLRPRGAGG